MNNLPSCGCGFKTSFVKLERNSAVTEFKALAIVSLHAVRNSFIYRIDIT